MALLDSLQWRYATKKMNGEKVSEEDVQKILEAAYLAPTSNGLQPYSVIVISNEELKQKLHPIAYSQSQILDGSHILVFAAWDTYTAERIDAVFAHMIKERNMPEGALDDYKNQLIGMFTALTPEQSFAHAARQSFLGLGMALAAAAELKIDSTPMEGFDPAGVDELLGLKEKGLKSVALLALGYRDAANDWNVSMKKVRRPKEEFILAAE